MLKVLDLFSGIGGFSLGLERTGGFETVAFCEIDPFCRKVLAKHWPGVPIYEDVRTVNDDAAGIVFDVLTGGYPCQPFSHAGKRRGEEDDRHLWPAMFEVIKAHRPAWIIGENVAGHISMGLDQVLSDLEGKGYAARPYVIPACAVGAPHRRDRVWIIAHADNNIYARGLADRKNKEASGGSKSSNSGEGKTPNRERLRLKFSSGSSAMANPKGQRCREARSNSQRPQKRSSCRSDVSDAHQDDVQGIIGGGNDEKERQEPAERSAGFCGGAGQARSGAAESELGGGSYGVSPWMDGSWEDGIQRTTKRTPGHYEGRTDRLKSLGNAVVPQIPEILGHAILEAEKQVRAA